MGSVHSRPSFVYAIPFEDAPRSLISAVREASPTGPSKPRLLDRVRGALRTRHYSRRTEDTYVAWIRRYILFHDKRHPAEMGAPEITRFLSALAVEGRSPPPPRPRRSARSCSSTEKCSSWTSPGWTGWCGRSAHNGCRSSHPRRSTGRAATVYRRAAADGIPALRSLRLLACCRLRVQDVDFAANQIVVRSGKGDKDRVTMLPGAVKSALAVCPTHETPDDLSLPPLRDRPTG